MLKHNRLSAWCGLVFVLATSPAFADGGKLQLSERTGPFQVSVFTSPTPLRAGTVDVSVLVQDAQTHALVRNAEIAVRAEPPNGEGKPVASQASHASATNRLLQAAYLDLPRPGRWRIRLTVEAAGTRSAVDVPVDVGPPLPRWQEMWPWLALPLGPILLFAAHHVMRNHDRAAAASRDAA